MEQSQTRKPKRRRTAGQVLDEARRQIGEIDPATLMTRLEGAAAPALLDIREPDEWDRGHIAGAQLVPRGVLEFQIERHVPDRDAPIVLYCEHGRRSALATRSLQEMGYQDVRSLAGGFDAWKRAGLAFISSTTLQGSQPERYSRQTVLPEIGQEGQARLLEARVLVVGAGGLGSPAALYLAAAGVGTIGLADGDLVDLSNLQRQVLYRTADVGLPKAGTAARLVQAMNPDVRAIAHPEMLTSENAMKIIGDYDLVVNGSDNFPARYLVNDACVMLGVPLIDGSVHQFEGRLTVYDPKRGGPCYRCLMPDPPAPGTVPTCAEAGVLGVLPGVIGTLQALETIKLVLGTGEPLIGRLLVFDGLSMSFDELAVRRDPACPVCGEHPTVTELIDYEQFCGLAAAQPKN